MGAVEGVFSMKQVNKSDFFSYFDLFFTFFKMGAVCFGGGYAMLAVLENELIEKKAWADREELMDYFALGQVTPGIIAVNVSTFIGYKRAGIAGGIIATLGFTFPSLIIIIIIAAFMRGYAYDPLVQRALAGVRVVVGVLIVNAVMDLGKAALKDAFSIIICASAFILSILFKVSPVILINADGLIALLRALVFSKRLR